MHPMTHTIVAAVSCGVCLIIAANLRPDTPGLVYLCLGIVPLAATLLLTVTEGGAK